MLYTYSVITPIKTLVLTASETHLVAISWANEGHQRLRLPETTPEPNHPLLRKAATQLDEYFAGIREDFDIPLAFMTGTPFQRRVWQELSAIPYGETRSYADIALAIGNPKAVRAVGMANHHNPISIIIPCHRVIGKDGSLTGYAGGLDAKTWLLEKEKLSVSPIIPKRNSVG